MLVQPDDSISVEYLPKVSLETEDPFQLPMVEANKAHSVSREVLDNLELVVSKSQTDPLIHSLYHPQKPLANKMAMTMATQYTDCKEFLQDTQSLLQTWPQPLDTPLTAEKEQELLAIWVDFAGNPEFLEKYCFLDWDAFESWNDNYYFMQSMSFIHGILPMVNMFFTVLILLIPLIWMLVYPMEWSKDSYLQCLRCVGGENQMMCHVLNLMNNQKTFCFQNVLLMLLIVIIYGFQFYFNIIHTERFFRHWNQAANHLREIKRFLSYTHLRMTQFQTVAKSYSSYDPFVQKMQQQQLVLQHTLQGLHEVHAEPHYLHDGIHMGTYLNLYHSFYARTDIQQMFQYSLSLHGYLDNMETVANQIQTGVLHCADFSFDNKRDLDEKAGNDEKAMNEMVDFYYPALVSNPVCNSIQMDTQVIITGPNASGKTTLIKAVALNFLFTQQVGVGFYQQCRLIKPYRYFHSYMNIPDTSERDSLFEAESRRCKHILTELESKPEAPHLCIFDELFSGTNPQEATQAATLFLKYLCQLPNRQQIDFLLTTHYVDLCHNLEQSQKDSDTCRNTRSIGNFQMKCLEKDGKLDMTFKMVPGISEIQGAMYVLEKMDFPKEICGRKVSPI